MNEDARNPSGFTTIRRSGHPTLAVTGRWSDAAAALLRSGAVDSLELNYALGFSEPNLDFLDSNLPVRRLLVLDRQMSDLSPIGRLSETLHELRVETKPTAAIDLAGLPRLTLLASDWNQVRDTLQAADSLKTLVLGGYDGVDLKDIALANLQVLELQEPGSLRSLGSVGRILALQVLRIFLARRLGDIAACVDVAGTLTELGLQGCPRLESLDAIGALRHLTFLDVSDCGSLASIGPVGDLFELTKLHAWGTTNFADPDLSPLLQLPHLKEVRMQSRKHYTPPLAEILRHIGFEP